MPGVEDWAIVAAVTTVVLTPFVTLARRLRRRRDRRQQLELFGAALDDDSPDRLAALLQDGEVNGAGSSTW